MDDDLIEEYSERLTEFLESGEKELAFPPMNSYQRRLVHQLASDFGLETSSQGEGHDRHICVSTQKGAKVPEAVKNKPKAVWNYGDKEFFVNCLAAKIEVYLAKDGTVALWDEENPAHFLDKREMSTSSFKIKNSKIVEITDAEW